MSPLLTLKVHEALRAAALAGEATTRCSLDLGRTATTIAVDDTGWAHEGRRFPWIGNCRKWPRVHCGIARMP